MTISTSVGRQFSVSKIVLLAYQGVGLRSIYQGQDDTQWQSELRFGKDMLEVILNELPVYGVFAKAISFVTQTLTVGTYKYTLDDSVLALVDPAVYIDPDEDVDEADGETLVRLCTSDRWQSISAKGATGRPTLCYPHRELDSLQAWIWPIPEAVGTIRFQVHRKLADVDLGSATLDLEEYWYAYVLSALKRELAQALSLPVGLQQTLAGEAEMRLERAKGMAYGEAPIHTRLRHPTAWSMR